MRVLPILLTILTLTTWVRAGGGFPEPVLGPDELTLAAVPTALLPAGLRTRLENDESRLFTNEEGQLPETLRVLTLDLNGDGENEYLVADPARYTGGVAMHIFAADGEGYREIGGVQGEFYTAAPVNGYAQLVNTARGGPDSYVRTLWVFEDGAYTEKKQAEYKLDDDGNFVFVQDLKTEAGAE